MVSGFKVVTVFGMTRRNEHPAARRVDDILSARMNTIRHLAVEAASALTRAGDLRAQADEQKALADQATLKLLELVPRGEVAQMLGVKPGELPARSARNRSAEQTSEGAAAAAMAG